MINVNPNITGTITIAILPQDNGQYICQLSPSLSDSPREDTKCYGFIPIQKIFATHR
jgi:hypothetical protein